MNNKDLEKKMHSLCLRHRSVIFGFNSFWKPMPRSRVKTEFGYIIHVYERALDKLKDLIHDVLGPASLREVENTEKIWIDSNAKYSPLDKHEEWKDRDWVAKLAGWKFHFFEDKSEKFKEIAELLSDEHRYEFIEVWYKVVMAGNYLEIYYTENAQEHNELIKISNFEFTNLTKRKFNSKYIYDPH